MVHISLNSYISSIRKGPDPLTKTEEKTASPDKLAEHSMRLALGLASKHFRGHEDYDLDLLSTAMNALVRQAQTFDWRKGRFSTVATHAIRRSIGVYKKKEAQPFIGYSLKDHERFGHTLVEYHEEAHADAQRDDLLDDLISDHTETRIKTSVSILPTRERSAIIQRYLIGRDAHDLAASMGITRSQLDGLCKRAIAKIREGLDG
jgi:RNA polymerase sigma factor (sigma-70 family)